ncbi:hypothetical protein NPIL_154171 [Nephila pilipes]|uniref:Uncharacterized protein n=1 Tax=Nephila pilipes TaxID=299642 RepID=A0A8X6JY65_NEPPI|nr:hypothetical protein NPIL_154171 [Nephila pilipes]
MNPDSILDPTKVGFDYGGPLVSSYIRYYSILIHMTSTAGTVGLIIFPSLNKPREPSLLVDDVVGLLRHKKFCVSRKDFAAFVAFSALLAFPTFLTLAAQHTLAVQECTTQRFGLHNSGPNRSFRFISISRPRKTAHIKIHLSEYPIATPLF